MHQATWITNPVVLGIFWFAGMAVYAAAYYHTEVSSKPNAPSFLSWTFELDVLTTKIIGLAVMGLWSQSWSNPAFVWFENILPHRPFAAFTFGFFVDVIALKVRQLILKKTGVDLADIPAPGAAIPAQAAASTPPNLQRAASSDTVPPPPGPPAGKGGVQ